MVVRKLTRDENMKTKALYQTVFTEDGEAFLDYYYSYVCAKNTIYTIEENSMLHLNPYSVFVLDKECLVNYIVAVATKKEFRKQGMMRELMLTAMKDMYLGAQPFTYLMPAAEAIYAPYDFVVCGQQKYYTLGIKPTKTAKLSLSSVSRVQIQERDLLTEISQYIEAEQSTYQELSISLASSCDAILLSEFFNKNFSHKYPIYTSRTPEYYEQVMEEQKAQNGAIVLLKERKELLAYIIVSNERNIIFREPMFTAGISLSLELDTVQNMMIRIINVESCMNKLIQFPGILSEFANFYVQDHLIPENNGFYEVKYEGVKPVYIHHKIESEEHLLEKNLNHKTTNSLTNHHKIIEEKSNIKKYTVKELTEAVFKQIRPLFNEIV